MDRQSWLAERRAAVNAAYDAMAPRYAAMAYPRDTQHEWVARLLRLCRPGGVILDAPCGTGDYFAQIVAAGHRVVGADLSAGMLAQARARALAEDLIRAPLHELAYDQVFDACITVDGMEHIPPEEWTGVLHRLHRALRPEGYLYLTVEEIDEAAIEVAFKRQTSRGLPVEWGEVVEGDVAGYHYYPGRERIAGWLSAEGLTMLDESYKQEDGWGYRHLLLRAVG